MKEPYKTITPYLIIGILIVIASFFMKGCERKPDVVLTPTNQLDELMSDKEQINDMLLSNNKSLRLQIDSLSHLKPKVVIRYKTVYDSLLVIDTMCVKALVTLHNEHSKIDSVNNAIITNQENHIINDSHVIGNLTDIVAIQKYKLTNDSLAIIDISKEVKRKYRKGLIQGGAIGFGNNISDASGNNRNGEMYAGTTWNPLNGGYWVFDGTDDRIHSNNPPYVGFTNEITVDFWVKWDANTFINWGQGCGQGILYNYDAPNANMWLMHGNQGNTVTFYVFNGPNNAVAGGTTPTLTMGQWYNIVGTMNSAGSSTYLNGTLVSTGGGLGGNMISQPASVLYLGGDVRYDFRFMNGAIASIHVYDTVLNSGQVSQNFNALRSRFNI